MSYKIGLLYGDGIGPEITEATAHVMKAAVNKYGVDINFERYPMGWEAIRDYGDPLPTFTKDQVSYL